MTPVGSTAVSKLKPSYHPRLLLQPMSACPAIHPCPRRLQSRVGIAELSSLRPITHTKRLSQARTVRPTRRARRLSLSRATPTSWWSGRAVWVVVALSSSLFSPLDPAVAGVHVRHPLLRGGPQRSRSA